MNINKVDVAGEYLREVELRLSGLPLLQRHELLADLTAHIETAREQGAYSDSEMVEVLQRLGSPEAIAAAAYEEAGPRLLMAPPEPPPAPFRAPAPRTSNNNIWGWVIAAVVGFFVLFLIGVGGLVFFARVDGAPAPAPAVQQPVRVPLPAQQAPEPLDGE